MKHDFIDTYSRLDSPIHRLPAAFKLFFAISAILFWTVMPFGFLYQAAVVQTVFFILLGMISRVPFFFILRRLGMVAPFLLVIVLVNGFSGNLNRDSMIMMTLRVSFSMLTLIFLVATTRFTCILKVLQQWKVPKLFLIVLAFMYRYSFILVDELEKMLRVVQLRRGTQRSLGLWKIYSNVLGLIFIKSYDRAERVHHAMVMRGFDGEHLS
ncbi:MAG: hypothetical protein CR997_01065 [Acidobacteria bacterium]|nr:MAG: hypothetical protein CR997_01065 [Acidobacteriota bacterium]